MKINKIKVLVIFIMLQAYCVPGFCAGASFLGTSINIENDAIKNSFVHKRAEDKKSFSSVPKKREFSMRDSKLKEAVYKGYQRVADEGWFKVLKGNMQNMKVSTLSSMPELIAYLTKSIKGKRILVIGSGRAELGDALNTDNEVVCVDVIPKFVEIAKKKGIEAYLANAKDIYFLDDQSFDIVVFSYSMPHMFDYADEVLKEAKRVLKDSGGLLVIDPKFIDLTPGKKRPLGYGSYTMEELCEQIENAGFNIFYKDDELDVPSIYSNSHITLSLFYIAAEKPVCSKNEQSMDFNFDFETAI